MNVEDEMRLVLSSTHLKFLGWLQTYQDNHHIDLSINIRSTFLVLTLIRHLGKNINGGRGISEIF